MLVGGWLRCAARCAQVTRGDPSSAGEEQQAEEGLGLGQAMAGIEAANVNQAQLRLGLLKVRGRWGAGCWGACWLAG